MSNQWNALELQAQLVRVDLIAKGDFGGLLYDRVACNYRSDIQAGLVRSRAWIESQIAGGATVTVMGVPFGSGLRMGIDRNLDGTLDGLERMKPTLALPMRTATNGFQFLLHGSTNLTVRLQRSTNLLNWQNWKTNAITENPTWISDPDAAGELRFFYRAQIQSVSP